MKYPGDTHHFLFPAPAGTITSGPLVTVINLTTGTAVVTAAAMVLVAGTSVYGYAWNTTGLSNGDYLAVVSYAIGSTVVNGQYLDKLQLGDTNVTGPVALDGTVAKHATVALDSTVAHVTDLATIAPDTSTVVLAIKAKTDRLPTAPAAQSDVTSLAAMLTDIHDVSIGSWSLDKTQNPKVLSFHRLDNTVLATFAVSEDNASATRTKTS